MKMRLRELCEMYRFGKKFIPRNEHNVREACELMNIGA